MLVCGASKSWSFRSLDFPENDSEKKRMFVCGAKVNSGIHPADGWTIILSPFP